MEKAAINLDIILSAIPIADAAGNWQAVLLNQDCIYKHWIMQMYDIRHGKDVVHPGTSHCNVIVLNPTATSSPSEHPFWYARVLGIYYANVIYHNTTDRLIDYQPRHLEVLWVRWYQVDNPLGDWAAGVLDRVHFPPMNHDDSFGFLDPANILRTCHIIPAFSQGKVHADGIGMSHLAMDTNDWKSYFVNR